MSSSPSSTPKLTLNYFGIPGRAEPIRFAFAASKIPFTNKVLGFAEFKNVKPTLPLGQVPTLDVEMGETKKTLTQTSAILRYVGKLGGLYPNDDFVTAMEIDEVLSILDDLRNPLVLTIAGSVKSLLSDETEFTSEEKLAIRNRWVEKTFPVTLGFIEKKITQNENSEWIVGDSLSIADLTLYCDFAWYFGGILDGVPTDVLDSYPACSKLMENVKSQEGIKKWMDTYSKPYSTFDYEP